MASIRKRPDGKWRARYRDAAGREHSRHFARKVDGQNWLDEVTASVVTGTYVDPKAGRTTLRAYAARWEAAQVGAPATANIIDNALRLHILPRLGDNQLGTLRRSDVQGLVKALTEQLGPGTVRLIYDVLSRMLAAAVDDRLIPSSPCHRIALPPAPAVEVVPPTVDQVRAVIAAMPPQFRAAVVLLAGSGLRIGELLGLRVTDVDFLRRTVRVDHQRRPSGELAPPKTPKSVRTVPLARVVVDELAAHLAAWPSTEWLFTDDRDGGPLLYRRWQTHWEIAASSRFGTHDLRHMYASALISGGASVKTVQTVLGHSSAAVTLKVYSHLWPGDEDRTRAIVDTALAGLRTGGGPQIGEPGTTAGQSG